jgi:transcriptional regulator with XRE-family HTH domain
MDQTSTGTLIRNLRLKLDMTQEEFAHSLGITVSTVNRWENGHSEPSKLARASIVGLSEKRGVTIDPVTLTMPQAQTQTQTPAPGFEAYAR